MVCNASISASPTESALLPSRLKSRTDPTRSGAESCVLDKTSEIMYNIGRDGHLKEILKDTENRPLSSEKKVCRLDKSVG